jgi:hypothetical protein
VPYLVDVLALELAEELVKAVAVSLNTDGLKDLLLMCEMRLWLQIFCHD